MGLSAFQRMRRLRVEGQPSAPVAPVTDGFDVMTKAELAEYAVAQGIGLGKAKTKAEMIAVLREAGDGDGDQHNTDGDAAGDAGGQELL